MNSYRMKRGYYGIPTGTQVKVCDVTESSVGIVAEYTDAQHDDRKVVTRMTTDEAAKYLEVMG